MAAPSAGTFHGIHSRSDWPATKHPYSTARTNRLVSHRLIGRGLFSVGPRSDRLFQSGRRWVGIPRRARRRGGRQVLLKHRRPTQDVQIDQLSEKHRSESHAALCPRVRGLFVFGVRSPRARDTQREVHHHDEEIESAEGRPNPKRLAGQRTSHPADRFADRVGDHPDHGNRAYRQAGTTPAASPPRPTIATAASTRRVALGYGEQQHRHSEWIQGRRSEAIMGTARHKGRAIAAMKAAIRPRLGPGRQHNAAERYPRQAVTIEWAKSPTEPAAIQPATSPATAASRWPAAPMCSGRYPTESRHPLFPGAAARSLAMLSAYELRGARQRAAVILSSRQRSRTIDRRGADERSERHPFLSPQRCRCRGRWQTFPHCRRTDSFCKGPFRKQIDGPTRRSKKEGGLESRPRSDMHADVNLRRLQRRCRGSRGKRGSLHEVYRSRGSQRRPRHCGNRCAR